MKLLGLVLLALPCASLTLSLTSSLSPSRARGPGKPTLADLAWLTGHWSSDSEAATSEEVWLAPAGRLMLAMNREVDKQKGQASFEYLRIEERRDGPVYVASPQGRGATEFTLAGYGERHVLFVNAANDFPKAIRYELDSAGVLHARISPDAEGKEVGMEWSWKRKP
jgi:hypothetical protein